MEGCKHEETEKHFNRLSSYAVVDVYSDRHLHLPPRQATVLNKGAQAPVAKSP